MLAYASIQFVKTFSAYWVPVCARTTVEVIPRYAEIKIVKIVI